MPHSTFFISACVISWFAPLLRRRRIQPVTGHDPEKWHTDVPTYASVRYRGVYDDGVKITSASGLLLDGERTPEAFTATGWRLSRR